MEDKAKDTTISIKSFTLGVLITIGLVVSGLAGAALDRIIGITPLDNFIARVTSSNSTGGINNLSQTVLKEESVVIDVAEQTSPSVVTVSVTTQRQRVSPFFMDPFGLFGRQYYGQDEPETISQDIGTGFVIDQEQGLIVTNKHVVSNSGSEYKVITKDDTEHTVERIYRDPANDLAIIKVSGDLPPALELGDSNELKVGQFVLAIGTALGEFRHTVTTGVISGLGRGISAGDGWGSYAEEIDNVIQTDAAINPGNSGGPLINSAGQVIGVNTAVAQASENIGFALPIDIVKASLDNFNSTGQFDRPFLGVRYQQIPQQTALLNDVPQGALIREVVPGSAADEAGIQEGDIITSIDGRDLKGEDSLATIINSLKAGQTVQIVVYRDGDTQDLSVNLKAGSE